MRFVLNDGRTLESEPAIARGNPENPLSDDDLLEKYRRLSRPLLGEARSGELLTAIWGLDDESADVESLCSPLILQSMPIITVGAMFT